jgi:hypothetical protein
VQLKSALATRLDGMLGKFDALGRDTMACGSFHKDAVGASHIQPASLDRYQRANLSDPLPRSHLFHLTGGSELLINSVCER